MQPRRKKYFNVKQKCKEWEDQWNVLYDINTLGGNEDVGFA